MKQLAHGYLPDDMVFLRLIFLILHKQSFVTSSSASLKQCATDDFPVFRLPSVLFHPLDHGANYSVCITLFTITKLNLVQTFYTFHIIRRTNIA